MYTMEEDDTIEVTGISDETTEDTLENYFSARRRGGEIADLKYYKDKGTAIIKFVKPEGAQQALKTAPHRLENATLTVQRKRAESLEPNKLYIEGFRRETTRDSLRVYIESISDVDVSDVIFGSRCNAIIIVNGKLDFDSIIRDSQRKRHEGKILTIKQVPLCRTILVKDLPETATEERILLRFESQRSGGGDVKNVDMDQENRTALVEFKDPTVLSNVLSRKQTLDDVEVKVTPHYPLLCGFKTEQKNSVDFMVRDPAVVREQPSVASTKHHIKIDPDLYQYLIKNHPENLKLALKDGKPRVDEREDSVVVTMDTSNAEDDFKKFLKDYDWSMVCFPPVLADYGLRNKMKDIQEIFGSIKAVSFHEHYSEGYIKIVGRSVNIRNKAVKAVEDNVKELKEKYEEETKEEEDVIETSKANLQLLRRSAKYQTLETTWRHQSVNVHLDTDRARVLVKGPRNQVTQVVIEIQQFVGSFGERELELKPSLLLKSPVAVSYVKKLLADNHVEIELSTNESKKISLHSFDQAQVDAAIQFITSTVRELKVPLNLIGDSSRRQEFRDDFASNVGTSTPTWMNIENDKLRVVCFEKDLSNLRLKANDFLEEKQLHKVRVSLGRATARYLKLYEELTLQGLRLSSPEISIEELSDAIIISGPKQLVASCEASIKKIVQGLTTETMDFGTPETCASITGEVAKKILLGIEQTHKCAIVVNVSEEVGERDGPGFHSTNAAQFKELMAKTRQCRYTFPNGKIIEVHQGDILNHPVDFLVNSANEELKHSGGIAKAIVEEGGYKIQEDCHNILKEKGKSKLMPGDVVSTDAGNLLCKKVLHVVVPKWKGSSSDNTTSNEGTREGRYLRHACLSVLNEAKEGKTVAIPALGTGIYKIPRAISARSLVTAADEFVRGNTHCELREVHFVDNEPTAVEAFMKEMIEKYDGDSNFEINSRVRGRWVSDRRIDDKALKPSNGDDGNAFCTKEGMKIQLTLGNIAASEADVIVNTVSGDLDLTKNPCSKALLQVGGEKLQEHCKKWVQTNGKVQEGSFAVTDGAKLKCKKVFHLSCPHWTPTDGEQKLRQIVHDVMSKAQSLKYTSVAIPAVGTGTLKYPEEIAAKVLFEESMKFSASHRASNCLKRVDIVVYNDNVQAVEKFMEKFQFYSAKCETITGVRITTRGNTIEQASNVPTSTGISQTLEEVSGEINGLKIEVVQGDMVQESTDAIAFLVGNNIGESGQLGSALMREAGESLRSEYAGINKVESGTVVMTSAGNLRAKRLLHMVPKKRFYEDKATWDNIRESLSKCLIEADSYQFTSISLPAIGTGSLGKDVKKSAEIMHASISEYAKRQIKSLELIRIVILQPTIFQKFLESFLKQESSYPLLRSSDVHDEKGSGEGSAKINTFHSRSQTRATKRISLDIVGENLNHMDEIKKDLYQIEKERCDTKIIENELIEQLPTADLKEILDLQNEYSVLIECKQEMGYLRLSGLSVNVSNAATAVYEKIVHLKEEKHNVAMSSQAVQWFFYDDSDGPEDLTIPGKYDEHMNAKIEKAYKQKEKAVTVGDNPSYKIDFDTMVETNLKTREVMKVFRSSREGFSLPEYWDSQPIVRKSGQEKDVYLVELYADEHPKEFDEVYEKFKKTMPKSTVVSIQRIQNPRLYQIYKGHQQKMNERGGCNEQKLFHGTAKDTVVQINSKGFNRAFCGKNATRFGRGVYFARNANYSSRRIYAVPDEEGVQYMYMARVLVGQYTRGKEGIIVPPPIDDSNTNVSYDTVVDDVLNPRIFVVFYDYQCYPEYLIAFKENSHS